MTHGSRLRNRLPISSRQVSTARIIGGRHQVGGIISARQVQSECAEFAPAAHTYRAAWRKRPAFCAQRATPPLLATIGCDFLPRECWLPMCFFCEGTPRFSGPLQGLSSAVPGAVARAAGPARRLVAYKFRQNLPAGRPHTIYHIYMLLSTQVPAPVP